MARSISTVADGREPSTDREGGWGIVVALAAHINMALSVGFLRCSGILYISWQNSFDTSAKETAAVQSILSSLHGFSGIFGGMLTNRFSCRVSGILGGSLASLGLFSSCWVTNISQLYITVAIAGVGLGIAFNAALFSVALYFKKKFKTANSVATSGVGTGLMVSPPLLQLLLESYGWRGTMLIASAVSANLCVCCALIRPRKVHKAAKLMSYSTESDSPNEDGVAIDNNNTSTGDEVKIGTRETPDIVSDDLPTSGKVLQYDFSLTVEDKSSTSSDSSKCFFVKVLLRRISTELGLHTFAKSYRALLLCIVFLHNQAPYITFVTFLIPRVQAVDVTPSSATFLLTFVGIGVLLGRLSHGMLISWKKVPVEGVLGVMMALCGVSLIIMGVTDVYVLLAVSSFLQGFTTGATLSITLFLMRHFVGLANFAVSCGWITFVGGTGLFVAPIISGLVLDLTASYPAVFYIFSGISFLGALQCLLFPLLKRMEPGINSDNQL